MKTVAIVGSHPATRETAPWNNPAVDIWVFNEAANEQWVKRWDVCFQMHKPTVYRNPNNRTDPKHWEWLQRDHGKPIYMQEVDPLVPCSKKYPLDAICKRFLKNLTRNDGEIKRLRYFTNSISYAIALAIFSGYERILLYGAEMQSNTEYSYQRDNVAFWVGLATGYGVNVEIHSAFNLFDQPMYGYDGDLSYMPEIFQQMADTQRAQLDGAKTALEVANLALDGIDATDNKKMQTLMKQAFDANADLGKLLGAIEQLEAYAEKAQAMIAKTGKAFISRQEFEFNAAMENKALEETKTQIDRLDGQLSYLYQVFLATKDDRAMMQFAAMSAEEHKLAQVLGRAYGKAYVNSELMVDADRRLRSAGGQKSFEAFTQQLVTA